MKVKEYKYLLFDLDHTLWDFEKNSSETLTQLFYEYELDLKLKISVPFFLEKYKYYNSILWKQYEEGQLIKEELRWLRFYNTLTSFQYKDEELAKVLGEQYISISPYKTHLIPNSLELLEQLHLKYKMAIITNGFEEIQSIKLENSGLKKYFDEVITSEMAGQKKPNPSIFNLALEKINGNRKESLMIGDNYSSDIMGAKNFGIDQAYLNPERKTHRYQPTYDITCLSELTSIL